MSLIRKLRDRLQGATLHDLWVETRWVLHHSKRYRRSIAAYVLARHRLHCAEPAVESLLA